MLGRFCSVQPLQSLTSSSSDMASHGRQQAGTAYPPLRCHSRLGCAEAMSAAVRQSAAHSRHWLLTASGARGVRDWCLASGRWRSGRRQTDPASGPRPPTQMRPFSLCYRCLQRRQSGVRLVQPQLESALVIAEWPASKPEPLRCARQRHLPCSSCQSTAWQAQPASTATADWRVPRP